MGCVITQAQCDVNFIIGKINSKQCYLHVISYNFLLFILFVAKLFGIRKNITKTTVIFAISARAAQSNCMLVQLRARSEVC